MYPTRIVLNCLARTACISAANTARSMQQVGLAFALEPALRWLYPAPADLRRSLARYTGHSNTHPFMAPLFVGILLVMALMNLLQARDDRRRKAGRQKS